MRNVDRDQMDNRGVGDKVGRQRFDRPTQRRYGDRDYQGTQYDSADRYAANIGNTGFTGEHFGKGPKGWKRSDETIKNDACEALSDDSFLDASEIEVSVKDGVIHLKGAVDERAAKRRAESCVEDLSGVNDVVNEIRIHRESGNLRATTERSAQQQTKQ